MILGVAGTFGAGKDTVANYLMEKGWQHISLSQIIDEEAERRGVELKSRDDKRVFSDKLADEWGRESFAQKALEKKKSENLVLTSIRKAEEVDMLHQREDFKLIFVDADISTRHKRMIDRGRPDEKEMPLDQLKEREGNEMNGKGSQNIGYCKEHADIHIDNNGSLEELYSQVDRALEKILI